MNRFFVDPKCIQGNKVILNNPIAHQVKSVLRLNPGQEIQIADNLGNEYQVRLESFYPTHIEGTITNKTHRQTEPTIAISLYQGIMKGDRFETTLQKGTEIGISKFVPVACERSQPKVSMVWFQNRSRRWGKILQEASEQSGRTYIPRLDKPDSLLNSFGSASGLRLIAWEKEQDIGLKTVIQENENIIVEKGISVFVGPEGGFSPEEIESATKLEVRCVSLGPRILRAETAGIVIASAVMYHFGELQ